jgi:hypothetical protein
MPVNKKPARIKLCQENRELCTSDCSFRLTCQKRRISFLILAIVINYRTGKIYPDEYINELAELRRDSLNNACLSGGKNLRDYYDTKLKSEAI